MAEVTAGLLKKVLPTKKRLYRIAEQAGFDANRIQDIYLPVVGGLALPWWALNGVRYKLPPEAVAVPVEVPQTRQVAEWKPSGKPYVGKWVYVEKPTGITLPAVDFRYRNGHVMFLARAVRGFEARYGGLHFTFDGREILLLVPWSDILLDKQVLTKC